ncbi:MAG: DNA repair protein RecO [Lachnospiraceae bacterium]|nr:DNA repair protein RecO [Lachnospiraceae bacterium]
MTGQVHVTGMVLVSMPVGDYDRRLTILTRERGKISAFAKGARKPTSPLLGCSQPFSFGEFVLYEGKSSYNVVSAEISNYFAELRNEVETIYYAMYFCEFSCYMTKENLEAGEPLKLLYMTLRALSKPALHKKLVRRIFELRFMAVNGEMPQVEHCVLCGRTEMLKAPKGWFSPSEGGICCENCRRKRMQEKEAAAGGKYLPEQDGVWIGTSTIYTMQYILATPLEKLFTFTVSEEVLSELSEAMDQFLAKHVGHKMKSEEMLDIL